MAAFDNVPYGGLTAGHTGTTIWIDPTPAASSYGFAVPEVWLEAERERKRESHAALLRTLNRERRRFAERVESARRIFARVLAARAYLVAFERVARTALLRWLHAAPAGLSNQSDVFRARVCSLSAAYRARGPPIPVRSKS